MDFLVYAEEVSRGTLRDPLQHFRSRQIRECTICGHKGYFLSAGRRQEARCPNCASKERDRIIGLYLQRSGLKVGELKTLHFSAERPFYRQWRNSPTYVAGDIKPSQVANAVVDITQIQFPENHFDVIICNHVLEHVPDDAKAMAECFRVLKPGGVGIFSVPLEKGQDVTWNPPPGTPPEEIARRCGRTHVRLYGRDFGDLLGKAGFNVETVPYSDEEAQRYRLTTVHTAEIIFLAKKPGA